MVLSPLTTSICSFVARLQLPFRSHFSVQLGVLASAAVFVA